MAISKRMVLLAILTLLAIAINLGSICPAYAGTTYVITYYTDATHTSVVGQSGLDCDGTYFSWGVTTPFYVRNFFSCLRVAAGGGLKPGARRTDPRHAGLAASRLR
jgi:hypothetical protein